MLKDKFVLSLLVVVIVMLSIAASSCHAKSKVIERCYEVTPGLLKCYSSDGSTRTLTRM